MPPLAPVDRPPPSLVSPEEVVVGDVEDVELTGLVVAMTVGTVDIALDEIVSYK
jgi:hypothetical protein